MDRLIENWRNSLKIISEHVNVYDVNLEDYVLSLDGWESYWLHNEEAICWGDTKKDVLDETGNEYTSDIKYIFKGEDFSLALVSSDFGDDDYFLILNNKKELR